MTGYKVKSLLLMVISRGRISSTAICSSRQLKYNGKMKMDSYLPADHCWPTQHVRLYGPVDENQPRVLHGNTCAHELNTVTFQMFVKQKSKRVGDAASAALRISTHRKSKDTFITFPSSFLFTFQIQALD